MLLIMLRSLFSLYANFFDRPCFAAKCVREGLRKSIFTSVENLPFLPKDFRYLSRCVSQTKPRTLFYSLGVVLALSIPSFGFVTLDTSAEKDSTAKASSPSVPGTASDLSDSVLQTGTSRVASDSLIEQPPLTPSLGSQSPDSVLQESASEDTSDDQSNSNPSNSNPSKSNEPISKNRSSDLLSSDKPRFSSVLYASARGHETFAVKGFLQALREFSLAPDYMVAEGHAAWPLAHMAREGAWDLLETQFRENLLGEGILGEANPGEEKEVGSHFQQPLNLQGGNGYSSKDPPQIRLSTEGVDWAWSDGLQISASQHQESGAKILRLSDHLLRLQAQSVVIPHCIQARHAASGGLGCDGPSPEFHSLKASLLDRKTALAANPPLNWLPAETAFDRNPHPETWNLNYEKLIVLDFGSLRAPQGDNVLVLPVLAEKDLPDSAGIEAWTERGYRTGLRSIDVLRKWLSTRSVKSPLNFQETGELTIVPFGSREGSYLRYAVEKAQSQGEFPHPRSPMLREISLDGSGGPTPAPSHGTSKSSQSHPKSENPTLTGDSSSTKKPMGDAPLRILYGAEQSYWAAAASIRLQFQGQDLDQQEPETFLQGEWCEPFYIPFRIGAGLKMGGTQPAYGWHFSLHPLVRTSLTLGVFQWTRAHDYDVPTRAWRKAGATAFEMRESQAGFGLTLNPLSRVSLGAEVAKINLHPEGLNPNWDDTPFEALRFQGEAALYSLDAAPLRWKLGGRWRFWDPVEVQGPVRDSLWEQTLSLQISRGDAEVFFRSHTGSLGTPSDDWTLPALGERLPGPSVMEAFRIPQEWVAEGWGGGFSYTLGSQNMTLKGTGGLRKTLRGTHSSISDEGAEYFWEAMATVWTRVGPIRAGIGGIDGGRPLWMISLGSKADFSDWIHRWKAPLSQPLGL
jgi:hypothetical protein